ncbi:MAG: DUF4012 domain-containing protein [Candidatus Shapirobacteria bacterium]
MKKKIIGALGAFVVLGVAGVVFLVLPVLAVKKDLLEVQGQAKKISQSFQSQDLNQTNEGIKQTKEALARTGADYRRLSWVKFLPYLGGLYRDGERFLATGGYLLEAGEVTVESIRPYADLLGFQSEDGEVKMPEAMTAEKRLIMALETLEKIQPNIDKISEKVDSAQREIDQIDAQRYPEALWGKAVRAKILELTSMVDGIANTTRELKPAIGLLRPLLGIPSEKRYLLLFQNDAELRPTGGFLTAYALLSVNNGNLKPLGSYDIYGLDARFGNRLKAPEPILAYHKNVFNWHLRDMNLSPDFKVSMETFMENYGKVADRGKIDGIIALDTRVLVDILRILGPIGVAEWGNFSAENDKRCDCPQVFYELEKMADQPVGTVKTDRKAVLGPLMHSVLLNVMQSPKKKWPEYLNIFFQSVQEKHLLFYLFDQEAQKAVELLNAGARIKEYEGDYLHLNDCNFAGAKSNMFIKENVKQEIRIAADGTVTKTVTVDYRNPAPPSNCNLEKGDLCLNGLYRDWVRLYVPEGSELIEASGSETQVKTYEELGKTVFEAFYGDKSPLRPEGKAQLTFKYELPFKVQKGESYKLLIQKQPGTYGYEYEVDFEGRIQNFELKTDKELKF